MAIEDELIKTQLRIPAELHEQARESAEKNFRSFNGELLYLISLGLKLAKEPASPDEVRKIVQEELSKAGK